MKTLNLIILLAALQLAACKKSPNAPSAPARYIGEMDIAVGNRSNSPFEIYGVSTDPQGNLFICGDQPIYDSSAGQVNYYPARAHIGSDTLNVMSANSPLTWDQGSLIKSLQNGNSIYSVIEISNATNNAWTGIRVIKTDLADNILWSDSFTSMTMATAAIQLSNTDLLIEGNVGTDPTATDNALVLMRLDTNGNTVFSRTYTGQYSGSSFDLLEETGNFTFVAYQVVNQPHYYQTVNAALLTTDPSGNVITSSPLDTFMGGSWHYFESYHLKKNQTGGYLLSTTRTDIVDPTVGGVVDEYFYLKLLNEQGATLTSVRVDTIQSFMYQAADVAQDKTGNIYLLMALSTSDWVPFILKFDSKGNFITDQGFSMGRLPFALMELPNSDMIMVSDFAAASSISLVKLDQGLKIL